MRATPALRRIAAFLGALGPASPEPRSAVAAPATALADSSAAFACDLFRTVANPSANLVLSPHSIASAFAMARAGAAGETAKQMDAVLRLPADAPSAYRLLVKSVADIPTAVEYGPEHRGQQVPAYSLAIANALFSQQGWSFQDAFRRSVADDFGAEFGEVDFGKTEEASTAINRWVEGKTQQRIKDLVPPGVLNSLTRMVLASAIHFKAPWAKPFNVEMSVPAPFFVATGREVSVPRMKQTNDFGYAETREAQVVALPYRGDGTAMLVVLPRTKDGLGAVVGNLSREKLQAWTGALRMRSVALELPRFTFTFPLELVAALQKLGMPDAFDPKRADFTGISTQEPLFISAALHKAFVAVDEKGTEAAAATAIVMGRSSIAAPTEKPVPFVADHPFLFLIRHEPTGAILFLGQVADPTAK